MPIETAIQIAPIFTPILLVLMGLHVTFWPPLGPVRWRWFGAFLVIGAIAVFTEFYDRNHRDKGVIAQVTGGDSFCHVDVTFSANDAITFVLRHTGAYTIPNVTVQLQDSADVAKLYEDAKAGNPKLNDDAFAITKLTTKTVYYGTASPNSVILLPTVPYRGERRDFFVSIAAHGLYRQGITVMRRSNGKDVVDNHLFKIVSGKDVEIWHQ
jgi:hypothetical protein